MSWPAASGVVLAFVLATGVLWYERSHPGSRVLALVATLAALAALGRIAFAPLPNVKPTSDIVLLAGYVLGGAPGFMVGAVAALASNFFFGQGPWTPWQMVAWGLVGLLGAGLGRATGRSLGRLGLTLACVLAGLMFGAVMNLYLWTTFSGDHTAAKLGAVFVTSLPFDAAHAVGNGLFCLAFGPVLVRALSRYRTRLEVTWRPAAAGIGLPAVLAAIMAGALALTAAAPAEGALPRRSVEYLLSAQNADGGFGATRGSASSSMHTGWTALGLAAAGRDPARTRRRGGRTVLEHLRGDPGAVADTGALTRTLLVLRAAGASPRAFGGRNLVTRLRRGQRRDGSFAGRVNTTSFALLALRASGHSARHRAVGRAAAWVAGQANPDGGFNFAGRGGPSGIDDTSAALQALAAAGRRRSAAARGAVAYLRARQNRDGGFPLSPGAGSNAQSTAWAVQALAAARVDPRTVRRGRSPTPLRYLRSLIARDGSVAYSRSSRQTPVWVTAQALLAFAEEPLPLERVRTRRSRARAADAPRRREAAPAVGPGRAPASPREDDDGVASPSGAGAQAGGAGGGGAGSGEAEPTITRMSRAERRMVRRARAAGILVGSFAWPLA